LSAGFASHMAFFLGDPGTTHISTLVGGMRVSTKKQVLGNIRFSTFSNNDRWFFQGDNRLSWTSDDTYGLGGDTPTANTENIKYNQFRFHGTAYRSVKPGLFAGLGLNISLHRNVRPGTGAVPAWDESAYVTYSQKHG